jgi:protein-S-isoprenylcysteine O-methyltransferase Ste14
MARWLRKYWAPLVVLIGLSVSLSLWWVWVDDCIWATHHTSGLAIIAPSFALWAVARHQLGASFTGRAEARALVTHGLYAKIRNPIYTFGALLDVGLLLFLGQPWFIIPILILTVIQILRARKEARVLDAAFGDAYRAYRAKTWF